MDESTRAAAATQVPQVQAPQVPRAQAAPQVAVTPQSQTSQARTTPQPQIPQVQAAPQVAVTPQSQTSQAQTTPQPQAPQPQGDAAARAAEQRARFQLAADAPAPGSRGPAPAPGPRGSDATPAQGSPKSKRAGRRARKPRREKGPSKLGLIVSGWWNRLIALVYSRSLSSQTEQYAAHDTQRDYIWNSVGLGAWGVVFPILSVVTTQLLGADAAGRFSMAFVSGTLLLYLANFGMRTFQVSDISDTHSFADYQLCRLITCAGMLVVGYFYCKLRGYGDQMLILCMGMFSYRAIDGLADVYEGRLQQVDKLYLAGVSQAVRSAAVIVAYSVVILITRNLGFAGVAMAVAALAAFLVLALPLGYLETPRSGKPSIAGVRELFVQCFPLFVALFLYNLIDNMPKFTMEGMLSYDNQLYFNALFSPAHIIIMVIGFIYKPQLMRLAEIWAAPKGRRRFDLIVLAVLAIIVALTLGVAAFMGTIGIPIMSFLYGVDFEQFRGLAFVMVATGGVCAAIDFLYQIITVLRRQRAVTRVYLLTLGFAIFVPWLLIGFTGLTGAVLGYLIVMCILLVLLVTEYLSIHAELSELNDELKVRRAERKAGGAA